MRALCPFVPVFICVQNLINYQQKFLNQPKFLKLLCKILDYQTHDTLNFVKNGFPSFNPSFSVILPFIFPFATYFLSYSVRASFFHNFVPSFHPPFFLLSLLFFCHLILAHFLFFLFIMKIPPNRRSKVLTCKYASKYNEQAYLCFLIVVFLFKQRFQ